MNGVVVQPGAEFSYTNTIPARTVENGYQMATVFVNKEKVKGLGGGICQVSSTLYAAMKTAGLPATERHPHSLPVDYLPEGWDATVSGQSVDLKFVNIYDKPLMIASSANGGTLTVSLYLVNK
jgi:vancomycin resistance protein YoaR